MIGPRARRILGRSVEHAADRAAGILSPLLPFQSARQAALRILDIERLPALEDTEEELQDEDGNLFFVTDYSAIGGPDLLRE